MAFLAPLRRTVAIPTTTLREAMQQASYNLDRVRFFKVNQDTRVAQLIHDLRSVIPIGESEREAHVVD
jgi:hypothetical protein